RRGRTRAADEPRVGVDRGRPAHQVALDVVAGFAGQERQLVARLDAFGHHRHAQSARQADDGAHDGGRLRVAVDVGYEGAVDLDRVEWERLQVGQRRIAGAEIVHGDPHAE